MLKWIKKRLMRGGRHVGKIRYGRLETAENACLMMQNKGKPGLTPYFCVVCSGYHIGHTPKFFAMSVRIERKK